MACDACGMRIWIGLLSSNSLHKTEFNLLQSTRVNFSSGGSLATRSQGKVTYLNIVISLNCLAMDQELSGNTRTATGRRKPFVGTQDREIAQVVGRLANKGLHLYKAICYRYSVTHIEHPTSIQVIP